VGIDLAAVGREGTDRFCHLNQEAFDLLVAVLQELGCDTTPLTDDRIDVVPAAAAAGYAAALRQAAPALWVQLTADNDFYGGYRKLITISSTPGPGVAAVEPIGDHPETRAWLTAFISFSASSGGFTFV